MQRMPLAPGLGWRIRCQVVASFTKPSTITKPILGITCNSSESAQRKHKEK